MDQVSIFSAIASHVSVADTMPMNAAVHLMTPASPDAAASASEQWICGAEGVDGRAGDSARRVAREEQGHLGDLTRLHRTSDQRQAAARHQVAVALGIDDARADAVDLDAVLGELGRQAFSQIDKCRFARPLGATATGPLSPADGRHIDDVAASRLSHRRHRSANEHGGRH